jgi:hypothetical protein
MNKNLRFLLGATVAGAACAAAGGRGAVSRKRERKGISTISEMCNAIQCNK